MSGMKTAQKEEKMTEFWGSQEAPSGVQGQQSWWSEGKAPCSCEGFVSFQNLKMGIKNTPKDYHLTEQTTSILH